MEAQLKKNCRIGARVTYSGKEGIVINKLGDIVLIRFEDGSIEHADESGVNVVLDESYQKTCSFCKGNAVRLLKEKQDQEEVYHCTNCSRRFSHNYKEVMTHG